MRTGNLKLFNTTFTNNRAIGGAGYQAGQGLGRYACGPQVGQQLLPAAPQGIAAQIEAGGLVAGHRKGLGLGCRQPRQEGLGQPVRQRLALGQGQGRIGRQRQLPARLLLAQEGAQQAIHHRSQAGEAAALGQFHAGAHGR